MRGTWLLCLAGFAGLACSHDCALDDDLRLFAGDTALDCGTATDDRTDVDAFPHSVHRPLSTTGRRLAAADRHRHEQRRHSEDFPLGQLALRRRLLLAGHRRTDVRRRFARHDDERSRERSAD